jgi:hypothetical protein
MKKFLTITLMFFGVVILTGCGQQPEPMDLSLETPQPISAQPDEETASWKKYSNAEFGFEIKYPPSYVVENAYDGIVAIKSEDMAGMAGPSDLIIRVNRDPSLNNLSLEEIIQKKIESSSIMEQQRTMLNGQDAYEGVFTGMVNAYGLLAKMEMISMK